MPHVSTFLRVLLEALARNSLSTSAGTTTRRNPSPAQSAGKGCSVRWHTHQPLVSLTNVCLQRGVWSAWLCGPVHSGAGAAISRQTDVINKTTLYCAPPPPSTVPRLLPVLCPVSFLYCAPPPPCTVPRLLPASHATGHSQAFQIGQAWV